MKYSQQCAKCKTTFYFLKKDIKKEKGNDVQYATEPFMRGVDMRKVIDKEATLFSEEKYHWEYLMKEHKIYFTKQIISCPICKEQKTLTYDSKILSTKEYWEKVW